MDSMLGQEKEVIADIWQVLNRRRGGACCWVRGNFLAWIMWVTVGKESQRDRPGHQAVGAQIEGQRCDKFYICIGKLA